MPRTPGHPREHGCTRPGHPLAQRGIEKPAPTRLLPKRKEHVEERREDSGEEHLDRHHLRHSAAANVKLRLGRSDKTRGRGVEVPSHHEEVDDSAREGEYGRDEKRQEVPPDALP